MKTLEKSRRAFSVLLYFGLEMFRTDFELRNVVLLTKSILVLLYRKIAVVSVRRVRRFGPLLYPVLALWTEIWFWVRELGVSAETLVTLNRGSVCVCVCDWTARSSPLRVVTSPARWWCPVITANLKSLRAKLLLFSLPLHDVQFSSSICCIFKRFMTVLFQ